MATSSTAVQNWDQQAPGCPQPEPAGGWVEPATLVDFVTDPAHPHDATVRASGVPPGQLRTGPQQIDGSITLELVGVQPADGSATLRLHEAGCPPPDTAIPLGLSLQLVDATGSERSQYLRVGPQLARWLLAYQVVNCR